jgi:hypothetical protein
LESDLTDTTNVLTDNDASITFDAGIDLITSSNGDIDLSPNGTGEVDVNAPLNTQSSATPTVSWKDSDATAGDDNATIAANATDVGDGTEDVDVTFKVQIAGALTEVMKFDADGNITTSNLTFAPSAVDLPTGAIGNLNEIGDLCAGDEILARNTGDTAWECTTNGAGAFSDAADPIVQNTTGKDVHVGDGAGTLTGKLEVGGDADQPQVVIEGHSTQTDSIFIIQQDDDDEVFSVNNDGTTTIGGSSSTITGSGTYVEIDDVLYITPAATPPLTCGSSYYGAMYHDTSGAICICNDGDAWEVLHDYTSGTTGACS